LFLKLENKIKLKLKNSNFPFGENQMIEFSFISFSLFETKIATLVRTLFSLRLSLSGQTTQWWATTRSQIGDLDQREAHVLDLISLSGPSSSFKPEHRLF
jgi:hypothetical protein